MACRAPSAARSSNFIDLMLPNLQAGPGSPITRTAHDHVQSHLVNYLLTSERADYQGYGLESSPFDMAGECQAPKHGYR
jgi:hypothetical protein